jgi:hypothetical protein
MQFARTGLVRAPGGRRDTLPSMMQFQPSTSSINRRA